MSGPVVAFPDPHGAEVRAAIQAEAPPEVTLGMVTSSDPAEVRAVAAGADFFVGGITPIGAELIDLAPACA